MNMSCNLYLNQCLIIIQRNADLFFFHHRQKKRKTSTRQSHHCSKVQYRISHLCSIKKHLMKTSPSFNMQKYDLKNLDDYYISQNVNYTVYIKTNLRQCKTSLLKIFLIVREHVSVDYTCWLDSRYTPHPLVLTQLICVSIFVLEKKKLKHTSVTFLFLFVQK